VDFFLPSIFKLIRKTPLSEDADIDSWILERLLTELRNPTDPTPGNRFSYETISKIEVSFTLNSFQQLDIC
jgi:hypothetical protein